MIVLVRFRVWDPGTWNRACLVRLMGDLSAAFRLKTNKGLSQMEEVRVRNPKPIIWVQSAGQMGVTVDLMLSEYF